MPAAHSGQPRFTARDNFYLRKLGGVVEAHPQFCSTRSEVSLKMATMRGVIAHLILYSGLLLAPVVWATPDCGASQDVFSAVASIALERDERKATAMALVLALRVQLVEHAATELPESAIKAVARLLQHPVEGVRLYAASALGHLGGAARFVLPELGAALMEEEKRDLEELESSDPVRINGSDAAGEIRAAIALIEGGE